MGSFFLIGFYCLFVQRSMPHSLGGPPLHRCGVRPQQFLPSKQHKHQGPGRGLDLPTKRMQGQHATTVLARRIQSFAKLFSSGVSLIPKCAMESARILPLLSLHGVEEDQKRWSEGPGKPLLLQIDKVRRGREKQCLPKF